MIVFGSDSKIDSSLILYLKGLIIVFGFDIHCFFNSYDKTSKKIMGGLDFKMMSIIVKSEKLSLFKTIKRHFARIYFCFCLP